MNTRRSISFLAITLGLLTMGFGQRAFEGEPMFDQLESPTEWSDYSAVILGFKHEISQEENQFKEVKRIRIKLHDQAALDEFGEITFDEEEHPQIRLIKPSGEIEDIDMHLAIPSSSTTTTFGRRGNQSETRKETDFFKLAIPNLAIGDILDLVYEDYWFAPKEAEFGYHAEQLGESFPVMVYRLAFRLQTESEKGNNLFGLRFRSLNGATPIEQVSPGQFHFGYEMKEPVEDEQWSLPLLDYPAVKYTFFRMEKDGHTKQFQDHLPVEAIAADVQDMVIPRPILRASTKKLFAGEKLAVRKTDFKDLIREWFLFLQTTQQEDIHWGFEGNFRHPETSELIYLMNAQKKPAFLLKVVPLAYGKIEDLISREELRTMWWFPEDQLFLAEFDEGSEFNLPSHNLEGGQALMFGDLETPWLSWKKHYSKRGAQSPDTMMVPFTHWKGNLVGHVLQVSLDLEENEMDIEMGMRIAGLSKIWYRSYWEADDYDIQRKRKYSRYHFGLAQSLSNYTDQSDSYYQYMNYQRTKEVIDDLENDFGKVAFQEFGIQNYGRLPNQSTFKFRQTFKAMDLIKPAGPHKLIQVGALLGGNIYPDTTEARLKDMHMPFARCYRHKIEIEIPSGYSVEGIKQLNVETKTEAGHFIAKAYMQKRNLVIEAEKAYYTPELREDQWSEVLPFLEAAYKYTQTPILLRNMQLQ
ncbi:hypothetical protein [Pontibacter sp. G13]|uniref:hypothetical protein n=1 Tax=Pontibacter sp. G13 TaxID=3074898 RepID=UPI00288A93F9|nr:hypothetical protein [Pontibacter sp. G13]WNJ19576.1 hypothetical protein RJD25_03725 [Pontibacter sp. G13]